MKKECPNCAVEVPKDSQRCPICGYEFPSQDPEFGQPKSMLFMWIAIILIILFLIPLVSWLIHLLK